MDYSSLAGKKFLGGIPALSVEALESLCGFLLRNAFFPLLHPHYDRFEDMYSVGILFNTSSDMAHLEVVGRGFDASDLRLGTAVPHESMEIDYLENRISERRRITSALYREERMRRIERVLQYRQYILFANESGRLITSLKDLDPPQLTVTQGSVGIPEIYEPIPSHLIRELREMISVMKYFVIPKLPLANDYSASFSYVPHKGWLLWDIYGSWYNR
jgi:hypothetical protein